MASIAQLIARNDTLKRRAVVPTYRAMARANVFFPAPRVFANSFPKAGTHLVATLLGRLPRMMASGLHRAHGDILDADGNPDWQVLERQLRTVNRGQYATGHFPHDPELAELLRRQGFVPLLCLRDPRDVAVSGVNYVVSLRSHQLHRRFTEQLTTFDDRLMAMIVGFASDAYGRGQDSLGERLARYRPWITEPGVCVVRYEELIGPSGGGDATHQQAAVRRVANAVGRPLDDRELARTAERVWSPRSSTFRAGRTGGWRAAFTPAHIEAFKATCGAELVELGYERDLDW